MPSRTSPIRQGLRGSTVAGSKSRQPISDTTASVRETHNYNQWCVRPRPPPNRLPLATVASYNHRRTGEVAPL